MIGTCLVPVRSGSNDAIPSARLAVSGPRTLKENPVLPDHERHDAAVPILRRDSNECEAAAHPTLLRPVTRATFGPLPFRSQDTRVVAVERHGLFLRAAMAFGRRPGSEFTGRARILGLPRPPMESILPAGCAGELPGVCPNSPAVLCLPCAVLLCLDKCIAKPDRVQFISTDSREHASSVPPAPSNRQPEPSLIMGSGTDDVNGLPANEFCTFESQDCGLRPKNEAGPSLRGLGKPGRCNRSEFRLILASQKPAGYSIFDPSAMPGISAFPCAYYNSRLQYAFA